MTDTPWRSPIFVWAGWLGFCLFIHAGPRSISDSLTGTLQGAIATILQFVSPQQRDPASSAENLSEADGTPINIAQLQAENRELVRLLAEMQLEQAQLRKAAPLELEEGPPLVERSGLVARIVGRRGDPLSESLQLLIGLGTEQGLHAGELVLAGAGLLIDRGSDYGLTPDQMLTAGRALFGRTREVGRHTSLVQPITDADFRMAVRIVRRGPYGAVLGPQGILVGTGRACRLDEVSATEAVAAGDEVFTDRLISPGAEPIYCGKVLTAEAGPADLHWKIDVAPLHSPTSLPRQLIVLKSQLNLKQSPEAAAAR